MSRTVEEWSELYQQEILSKDEKLALAQKLDSDQDFREAFVEYITFDAAIGSALTGAKLVRDIEIRLKRKQHRVWLRISLAAAVLIVFSMLVRLSFDNKFIPQSSLAAMDKALNARWSQAELDKDGRLYPGEYSLDGGSITFTFDSGAVAQVSAPAIFELVSPFKMKMNQGEAVFLVEDQARGFSVDTPQATVVDLGTAFSVSVSDTAAGSTDIQVIDGSVEVSTRNHDRPIAYGAEEAVRYDSAGKVQPIQYLGNRFQVPRPRGRSASKTFFNLTLDKPRKNVPPLRHRGFKGKEKLIRDAQRAFQRGDGPVFVEGQFGEALLFQGGIGAPVIAFSGVRPEFSYTISFWVKIPRDAPPTESTMMELHDVYLRGDKMNFSWNTERDKGMYGALRFNYGNGFITGSAPLNDGQWHHVALTFLGGKKSRLSTHFRLYIDGKLDEPGAFSEAIIAAEKKGRAQLAFTGFQLLSDRAFYGYLDEVFVSEGVLHPHEIYAMYQSNKFPADEYSGRK